MVEKTRGGSLKKFEGGVTWQASSHRKAVSASATGEMSGRERVKERRGAEDKDHRGHSLCEWGGLKILFDMH